jgi:hypothetical protein
LIEREKEGMREGEASHAYKVNSPGTKLMGPASKQNAARRFLFDVIP